MIIRFSSIATESMIMLGETAKPLIRMMGASGAIPGAIYSADIPDALMHLRQGLHSTSQAHAVAGVGDDDAEREEQWKADVPLAIHARPLIDLLERACAEGAPVMWEETKTAV
jgi:hypothetical protein